MNKGTGLTSLCRRRCCSETHTRLNECGDSALCRQDFYRLDSIASKTRIETEQTADQPPPSSVPPWTSLCEDSGFDILSSEYDQPHQCHLHPAVCSSAHLFCSAVCTTHLDCTLVVAKPTDLSSG